MLPPRTTVLEAGAAEIVKSGAGVTARPTVVVRVSAPLDPAIARVELPVGVSAAVVTVNAALPAPVTVAGLKEAVALAGNSLMARFTGPVNPFTAPIVTV